MSVLLHCTLGQKRVGRPLPGVKHWVTIHRVTHPPVTEAVPWALGGITRTIALHHWWSPPTPNNNNNKQTDSLIIHCCCLG